MLNFSMKGDNMLSDYFTTLEAAAELDVAVSTIQRYFDKGLLKGVVNPVTGRRRVTRTSVKMLMSNRLKRHLANLKKKGGETNWLEVELPL
jgi:hypothetical protein